MDGEGYTAVLSPDEKTLDLSGVATIGNASGATYENARLKLVAGELNLVEPMEPFEDVCASICITCEAEEEEAFEEKTFFEYHLYTLQRPCTIQDNEVKQIELFRPVTGVPVEKSYVYHGALLPSDTEWLYLNTSAVLAVECNDEVDVNLHFRNEKEAGLGMPLPAGPVRIFKQDPADGEMELVGDDLIDHTPKDEEITLRLGSAFDITGKRRQTAFWRSEDEHRLEESFEIVLRNHKDEDVQVTVKETMYRWLNWEITKCSCDYRANARRRTSQPPADWHEVLLKTASRTRASFEFVDTPLDKAVAFLKAHTGAKIVLDPELDPHFREAPITIKAENEELPVALERIARKAELECRLKDDAVFITERLRLVDERTYDIFHIGVLPWSLPEMIQCSIEPDTWAPEYGTSIEGRGRRLVVRQSPRVHRKIERFLADVGLGIPLPKGTVRGYKEDPEGKAGGIVRINGRFLRTMQGPQITTVIPTYRRPKLLRRAIESVLAQTYPHLKVTVFDNASGDETPEVVAELARCGGLDFSPPGC